MYFLWSLQSRTGDSLRVAGAHNFQEASELRCFRRGSAHPESTQSQRYHVSSTHPAQRVHKTPLLRFNVEKVLAVCSTYSHQTTFSHMIRECL